MLKGTAALNYMNTNVVYLFQTKIQFCTINSCLLIKKKSQHIVPNTHETSSYQFKCFLKITKAKIKRVTEMPQPLQFILPEVFTFWTAAFPEDCLNHKWAQVRPTKLVLSKSERLARIYWGSSSEMMIRPVMISPLSATTRKYRQAFNTESITLIKQGTKPRMNMVQCKTTDMI